MRGMPGPVRDKDNLYGLPSNSAAQQREADKGTLMATRSVDFIMAMEDSEPLRLAPSVASLENPADPAEDPLPSAFQLPEVLSWTDQAHVTQADYNHCAYQRHPDAFHGKEQT